MRHLVVTGDDFGSSREVNGAIAEAYDHGVLTNASLMVGGEAAEEAVALARSRPGLSVGLHVVVVDGPSVLPAREIPRLVDSAGRFRGGAVWSGLRYQFSRRVRSELEREIRAQFDRFEETGLPLSHVDGHHHMHLHPVVLEILLRLTDRFSIPSVRLPAEELGVALSLDRRGATSKILSRATFALLHRHAARRLGAAGIHYAERVYGLLATGRITEDYLIALIPRIRANCVELYCHPATAVPGEPFRGPPGSGPEELAGLVSATVRRAFERSRFVLARREPVAESVQEDFLGGCRCRRR